MQRIDFANAPKLFYNFEQKNFDALSKLRFEHWPLWQIVKLPLFYTLIHNADNEQSNQKVNTVSKWHLIKRIAGGFYNLGKLLLWGKFLHGKALFVTHHVDSLAKRDSQDYNTLFDGIISQSATMYGCNHLEYMHASKKNRYCDPQVDISDAEALFGKLFSTSKCSVDDADELIVLWKKFVADNEVKSQAITSAFIYSCCANFKNSFAFWKKVLSKIKPSKVYSSEKMGTGLMAACLSNKVPIAELQHGNIDKYYSHYVWDARWREIPNAIKPNQLALFGECAKQIVINANYIEANEIYVLGYEKIEAYREKIKTDGHFIFVAMQPLMHAMNIEILKTILPLAAQYPFAIKCHPLQAAQEVQAYQQLIEGSSIIMWPFTRNIYECIQDSKIIVAHISTVLEEALSLGKIAITISTEQLPLGLHSMTGNEQLATAIQPCSVGELAAVLADLFSSTQAQELAMQNAEAFQDYIYQRGYKKNILNLLG